MNTMQNDLLPADFSHKIPSSFIVREPWTYVITNVTGIKMKRLNGNTCSFPYTILVSSMLQDTYCCYLLWLYPAVRCVQHPCLNAFFIGMIKIGGETIVRNDRWIKRWQGQRRDVSDWIDWRRGWSDTWQFIKDPVWKDDPGDRKWNAPCDL